MNPYSLTHVSDGVLLRDLAALVARDRANTAHLLAHIAEVDARKLYLPAAQPSMYSYCVHELGLSEDAAFKRIRAARAGRRFPAIFEAVADGRLHLSAVVLLAPYLTPENAAELLAAAERRNRARLEQLLAERFPRPDVPVEIRALSRVTQLAPGPVEASLSPALGPGQVSPGRLAVPLAPIPGTCQLAPGPVEAQSPLLGPDASQLSPGTVEASGSGSTSQLAPGPVAEHAPGRVEAHVPRPRLAALAPGRFALQLTIGQGTHDKLRHAQALLGHQVAAGDLAGVLDRALDALIERLERRKCGSSEKPRPRRPSKNARHVPAEVRRAVWQRDEGRCTFVSDAGKRCPATSRLEYDHVTPVARGGRATVSGIRLRCRAHNQYAAECEFGEGFMRHKREQMRLGRQAAVRSAASRGSASG